MRPRKSGLSSVALRWGAGVVSVSAASCRVADYDFEVGVSDRGRSGQLCLKLCLLCLFPGFGGVRAEGPGPSFARGFVGFGPLLAPGVSGLRRWLRGPGPSREAQAQGHREQAGTGKP